MSPQAFTPPDPCAQEALVQKLTASSGGAKATKQVQQRLNYVLSLWCVLSRHPCWFRVLCPP